MYICTIVEKSLKHLPFTPFADTNLNQSPSFHYIIKKRIHGKCNLIQTQAVTYKIVNIQQLSQNIKSHFHYLVNADQ